MWYRTAMKRYVDARVAEGERAVTLRSGRNSNTGKMAVIPLGQELKHGRYSRGELVMVLAWVLLLFGFVAAFPAGAFLGVVGEVALVSPAFAVSMLGAFGHLETYPMLFFNFYGGLWLFSGSWGAIIGPIITPIAYLGLVLGTSCLVNKAKGRLQAVLRPQA